MVKSSIQKIITYILSQKQQAVVLLLLGVFIVMPIGIVLYGANGEQRFSTHDDYGMPDVFSQRYMSHMFAGSEMLKRRMQMLEHTAKRLNAYAEVQDYFEHDDSLPSHYRSLVIKEREIEKRIEQCDLYLKRLVDASYQHSIDSDDAAGDEEGKAGEAAEEKTESRQARISQITAEITRQQECYKQVQAARKAFSIYCEKTGEKRAVDRLGEDVPLYRLNENGIKFKDFIKPHMDKLNQQIRDLESVSEFGMVAARALAGPHWAALQGSIIGSAWQGIRNGLAYRTLRVVGDKYEEMIKNDGEAVWHTVIVSPLRSIFKSLNRMWHTLFDNGFYPFSVDQLDNWKTEVLKGIFENLEKHARDSERNQASGRDTKRRTLPAELADLSGLSEPASPVHNKAAGVQSGDERDQLWSCMARGYADDISRLVRRIQAHKRYYERRLDGYYSEESDIVGVAARIQEILIVVKDKLLLPARSLKDLALGDNRLLLMQLAKDIERRFDLLNTMVRQYHGVPKRAETKQQTTATHKNRSYGGLGDGFGGI